MSLENARKKGPRFRWFAAAAALLMLAAYAAIVMGAGATADIVLGQSDFTSNSANMGGSTSESSLYAPYAVAIDASVTPNRLYVADAKNNRVLGWHDVTALSNGDPADLVLGQTDFVSNGAPDPPSANSLNEPTGLAVDSAGNLYVADISNNRVLEYNAPFTACDDTFPCVGGGASEVFGQLGSFTSFTCDTARTACAVPLAWRWTPPATSTSPTATTTACWSTTRR